MAVERSQTKADLLQLIDCADDEDACEWADNCSCELIKLFEGDDGFEAGRDTLAAAAAARMSRFLCKLFDMHPQILMEVGPELVCTLGKTEDVWFCELLVEHMGQRGDCSPEFVARVLKACSWDTGTKHCSTLLVKTCCSLLALLLPSSETLSVFHSMGVLPSLSHAGSADLVGAVVAMGANPCAANHEGYSGLHMACVANDVDMVNFYLALPAVRSANPMAARDRLGRTPLATWASHAKNSLGKQVHAQIVQTMLDLHADINVSMERGRQPLSSAVVANADSLVEVLLEAGADCEGKDLDQRTALQYACLKECDGSAEIIALLLKGGANPQTGSLSPVVQVVDTGRQSAFMVDLAQPETLIAQEAGVPLSRLRWQFGQWPPILSSCREGHIKNLAALLACGANPNASTSNGLTAVHIAALHNKPHALHMLIASGAQCTTEGPGTPSPLHYAAWSGSLQCAQILLDAHAKPTASSFAGGQTPAHWAAAKGHVEILKMLLPWATVLLQSAGDGSTPLMRAAAGSHGEAADLLLAHGALMTRRDKDGRRACDMAATLDLRAQLTPLPRRFVEGEIRPGKGVWLVSSYETAGVVATPYLSAELALKAILAGAADVKLCCSFHAVPAAGPATAAGGGFGSISLGVFPSSGQPCAVKSLHSPGSDKQMILEKQRELAYEIRIQQSVGAAMRLSHVLGTIDWMGSSSSVSDFVPGVTWDWFCKLPRSAVPAMVRLQLASSLIDAINELSSAEVAHRDIHGGNVMVYVNSAGVWQISLVDFGLSFQWSMRVDGYSAKALSSMHIGLYPPTKLPSPDGNSLDWQHLSDYFGAACLISWLSKDDSVPSRDEWLPEMGSFGNLLCETWQHWDNDEGNQVDPAEHALRAVVLGLLEQCKVKLIPRKTSPELSHASDSYADSLLVMGREAHSSTEYLQGVGWQGEQVGAGGEQMGLQCGIVQGLKSLLQLSAGPSV